MPKPEPVPVSLVCSLCGLDWNAHGEDPSKLTCIELLRAELDRRAVPPFYVGDPPGWWQQWTSTNITVGDVVPGVTYSNTAVDVLAIHRDDDDGTAGVRVPA